MERKRQQEDKIKADNYRVFALLSNYLNHEPDFIEKEEIEEIVKKGFSSSFKWRLLYF